MTADGYLYSDNRSCETDVRASPNSSKVVITMVIIDRTTGDYCLRGKDEGSVCSVLDAVCYVWDCYQVNLAETVEQELHRRDIDAVIV